MTLKSKLLNILYLLPFGLKGADSEVFGSSKSTANGASITQEASDARVGKHLLKGEVTQEVEELRYRTYKVADESSKYDYIGGTTAVKREKPKSTPNKIKFSQSNENICESVLETLKQVDGKPTLEKYRFEMSYYDIPRFKIEKYATSIDVTINKGDGGTSVITALHFSKFANPYDSSSKQFINELVKVNEFINDKYAIKNKSIFSSLQTLSFSTYKASNEDDFTIYSFMNNFEIVKYEETSGDIVVTLKWGSYTRLPLNLEEMYYSKSMAEKYDKKEKKHNTAMLAANVSRKVYCSVCGREMSVYDADILRADGKPIICKNCLKKTLKNSDKKL